MSKYLKGFLPTTGLSFYEEQAPHDGKWGLWGFKENGPGIQDPSDLPDEYYEEVEKRIRLEFPHKFDKIDNTSTERTKPVQNVASAKRSASTNKGRKTVKLTPSQVAIAKRLGVPLEEYAKQLNITEGV